MFNNNDCNNLIYRNNNNSIIIATVASELYRTMSSVSFVFVFQVLCYNNNNNSAENNNNNNAVCFASSFGNFEVEVQRKQPRHTYSSYFFHS